MSDDKRITHENYLNSTYTQNIQNRNSAKKGKMFICGLVVWQHSLRNKPASPSCPLEVGERFEI